VLDPDTPALGGAPERLRIDHGLEFCAEAVRAAALALGIEFSLATTYTPEEKGRIERLHLTCVQTFLSGLPHYTSGRRDQRRRLDDPRAPLTLEAFVGAFAGWVTEYNRRAHSELAGQSPIDAFTADPTPLRPVSVEEARALLAARKDAKVRRFGIQHDKHNYVHPELHELVGEIVEIAFAPHDQRSVEVYWRGDWVCTAVPQETLTAEEQGEVIHARKAYAKELRARQRKAARAARTRIAPLTATDPEPVETTRLSERNADVTRAGPAPAARTDLLIRPGPPRARHRSSV
jgi:putative transposase